MPATSLPDVLPLPLSDVPNPAVPAAPSPRSAGRSSRARGFAGARIGLSRCLLAGLVLALLFVRGSWSSEYPLGSALLMTAGLLLTGMAAAGRLWCSLHIAGYKDRRLVREGPYSVCRHPLYFFSLLGAVGAAAATGTFTVPLLVAAVFLFSYQPVMAAEERKLGALFGGDHEAYLREVPRLFPRWSRLRHAPSWNSNPEVFFKHASAVIWFPAAAGFLLMLQALQAWLDLPVIMKIP